MTLEPSIEPSSSITNTTKANLIRRFPTARRDETPLGYHRRRVPECGPFWTKDHGSGGLTCPCQAHPMPCHARCRSAECRNRPRTCMRRFSCRPTSRSLLSSPLPSFARPCRPKSIRSLPFGSGMPSSYTRRATACGLETEANARKMRRTISASASSTLRSPRVGWPAVSCSFTTPWP